MEINDEIPRRADLPVVEQHEAKGALGRLRVRRDLGQVGRKFAVGEEPGRVDQALDVHQLIVATEPVVLHLVDELVAECGPRHGLTARRNRALVIAGR